VTKGSEAAPAGIETNGFWGIAVRPHTVYSGSFYAKTDSPGIPVTVTLQNDQTAWLPPRPRLPGSPATGISFTFTLKTGDVPISSSNHLLTIPRRPRSGST